MMKNKGLTGGLDEMQEMQLLRIERGGCWLAFWGLSAAIFTESIVFYDSADLRMIGAECAVLMALALYMVIACARRGIWDRRLKMNQATLLGGAAIAGMVTALLNFFVVFRRFPDAPVGSLASAAITGAIAFILIYIVLLLLTRATRRRMDKLNAEPDE